MIDIVEQLRQFYTADDHYYEIKHSICDDAADEIERLRSELEAARADVKRLDWVLPILGGDDTNTANQRTVLIAKCLMIGLAGRKLINAAMALE